MKSFRLATEDERYHKHAFISFKTDPDEPIAQRISASLTSRDLEVTYIHGDTTCPHPFGTPEANRWIRKFLSGRVLESRVLLSIASEASLRSSWVFQEFYEASQSAKLILMLWFGGPDPTVRFVPPPRQLTKRLPSCAVYLIDCREDAEKRLEVVSEILHSLPRAKRELFLRRLVMSTALLGLMVVPIYAMIQLTPQTDDPIAQIRSSERIKILAGAWLYLVFLFGAIVLPGGYLLPRPYRNLDYVRQIVPGFGLTRYVLLLLLALAGFGLFPLGGLPAMLVWGVCSIPLSLGMWFLNRFLRSILIKRSYSKVLVVDESFP